MNQSNIIFAYLFLAFVVFVTVRGELGTYLGFFGVGGQGKGGNLPAASSGSSGGLGGALTQFSGVLGGQVGGQLAGVLSGSGVASSGSGDAGAISFAGPGA